MKETSLVHMKVPEEAKLLETKEGIVSFSGGLGFHLSTVACWVSCTYTGALSTFLLSLGAANEVVGGFAVGTGVTTSVAVVTTGVLALTSHNSFRDYNRETKEMRTAIDPDEWQQWAERTRMSPKYATESHLEKGYRIRQTATRSILPALLSPLRVFRKSHLTEVLWYNPISDVFTREVLAMGKMNTVMHTEKFAGRRATFKKALNSI